MKSLQKRIDEVITEKTKPSGEWGEILSKSANDIKANIQEEIDNYYIDIPKVYTRTGKFKQSLRMMQRGKSFIIYFSNEALHDSIYHTHISFVPTLVDHGWDYSPSPYHFGTYDGYDFIPHAIQKYRQSKNSFATITIQSSYYSNYYKKIH